MFDNSFLRFMNFGDGLPLIPSGPEMRTFWFEQKDRYNRFMKFRDRANLVRVFNLFGEQPHIENLKIDQDAAIPFLGEWYSRITLGKNIRIEAEAILMAHGGIKLGDNTSIGQRALIITVGHPVHPLQRHLQMIGPIVVGANTIIGSDAIVVNSGRTAPTVIGEGSIILPGAVVTKDIPPYSIVDGNNKIVISGEKYFLPPCDRPQDIPLTLESCLSPEGVFHMLGLDYIKERGGSNLVQGINQRLQLASRIYRETDATDTAARNAFFSETSPAVLDSCMIPSPVYVTTVPPILAPGTIVNLGCSFNLVKQDQIVIAPGTLFAPYTTIEVGENGRAVFEPQTWCGARTEVKIPANSIATIGRGSILAAGARVGTDIPEMSIVIGDGHIVKTITGDDILGVPSDEWNDVAAFRAYHVKTMHEVRSLSTDERHEKIRLLTQYLGGKDQHLRYG